MKHQKIELIVAIYYVITGLGFLCSSNFYQMLIEQSDSDPVLINLSGMVHFFIGITILVNYFLWNSLLKILTTISGFLFLTKGLFLIVLPEVILQSANNSLQKTSVMGMFFLIFGLLIFTLVISTNYKKLRMNPRK